MIRFQNACVDSQDSQGIKKNTQTQTRRDPSLIVRRRREYRTADTRSAHLQSLPLPEMIRCPESPVVRDTA